MGSGSLRTVEFKAKKADSIYGHGMVWGVNGHGVYAKKIE